MIDAALIAIMPLAFLIIWSIMISGNTKKSIVYCMVAKKILLISMATTIVYGVYFNKQNYHELLLYYLVTYYYFEWCFKFYYRKIFKRD
jgi:hypothetical protein